MRKDMFKREIEVLQWIKDNKPKAFICRELNCRQATLNSFLKKIGVDYNGNKGAKGYKESSNKKTVNEYLSKKYGIKSYILKKKLIDEGIKKEVCEICGNIEWMNEKIPLELHHIDGDKFNNNLENIMLICPNCHALTPNYRNKNDMSKNIKKLT